MILKKIKNKIKQKQIIKRFPTSDIHVSAKTSNETHLEGFNKVGQFSNIVGSKIGAATIIGNNCYLPNCSIGRFSSVSSDVIVVEYTHPISFVSTHPGFIKTINDLKFGKGEICFDEVLKNNNGAYVNIGNDVWIGRKVLIKGGVTIGDGAIIGMGSVVTKDVLPYSIVAGNPAKLIRFRFDEQTIRELLILKWWLWDLDEIKSIRTLFNDSKKIIDYGKKRQTI